MIRNDKEYREAIRRLKQDASVIERQEKALKKAGLRGKERKRAMAPMLVFHDQLAEEVQWYERVKRKNFDPISSLIEIGRLLIALRIASGLTQKKLAKRLGVTEAQVSRDERNEYHGISIERAQRIMEVFQAQLKAEVEVRPLRPEDRKAA